MSMLNASDKRSKVEIVGTTIPLSTREICGRSIDMTDANCFWVHRRSLRRRLTAQPILQASEQAERLLSAAVCLPEGMLSGIASLHRTQREFLD